MPKTCVMSKTYLVTGAAGFLGSHLTAELLAGGARVYALARGHGEASAAGRIAELAPYFAETDFSPIVLDGDVEEPWLGLGERAARRVFADVDEVVHCAARVDFTTRRERTIAINAEALQRFLPLLAPGGPVFNLVSTAYVCGETDDLAREEPVPAGRSFRNAYEESKALAERFVAGEMARRGIAYRILRPAIIVGDSRSGRTRSFNAVYLLLELLDRLRKTADGEGTLRIRCDPASALNLVPVDYVTRAIRALLDRPETAVVPSVPPGGAAGGIFHLAQSSPLDNRRFGGVLSELFAPLKVSAAGDAELAGSPLRPRESLVARGLSIYDAYLSSHPRFDDRRTRRALRGTGVVCPPVDRDWLAKLVDYGRRAGWGRRAGGRERRAPAADPTFAYCRRFFDEYLKSWTGHSLLPDVRHVNVTFEVRLTDLEGFRRIVEVRRGELVRVGATGAVPECRYELASDVLRRIASAELDAREAFFARLTEIRGDVEAGLRMAALMVEFFRRRPFEGVEEARWALPG